MSESPSVATSPSALADPAGRALELFLERVQTDPDLGPDIARVLEDKLSRPELPSVSELLSLLGAP